MRRAAARMAESLCAALAVAAAVSLFAVNSRKSVTNDEMILTPAGYYHLVEWNFQLDADHQSAAAEMSAVRPLPLVQIFPRRGLPAPPGTRYFAVGASFLNGSTVGFPPGEHGRLQTQEERVNYPAKDRDRAPEAVFGGTIYLFREHE